MRCVRGVDVVEAEEETTEEAAAEAEADAELKTKPHTVM